MMRLLADRKTPDLAVSGFVDQADGTIPGVQDDGNLLNRPHLENMRPSPVQHPVRRRKDVS
jgi:hypothetical protein